MHIPIICLALAGARIACRGAIVMSPGCPRGRRLP